MQLQLMLHSGWVVLQWSCRLCSSCLQLPAAANTRVKDAWYTAPACPLNKMFMRGPLDQRYSMCTAWSSES